MESVIFSSFDFDLDFEFPIFIHFDAVYSIKSTFKFDSSVITKEYNRKIKTIDFNTKTDSHSKI